MINSEYIRWNEERHGHDLLQDDIPEFPWRDEINPDPICQVPWLRYVMAV